MRELSPMHSNFLLDCGFSEEEIAEHGFFTVETRGEMHQLGFRREQRLAPALILPLKNQYDEECGYYAVPHHPRRHPESWDLVRTERTRSELVSRDVTERSCELARRLAAHASVLQAHA